MAKSLLVAAMVMCLAAVVFSSALKETRAVQFLKHIRSATEDETEMIFLLADTDKDGKLDGDELRVFCLNVMEIPAEDLDFIVILALSGDTDKDGKLDKAEFETLISTMARK